MRNALLAACAAACLMAAQATHANGADQMQALFDSHRWINEAQIARRGPFASAVATGAGAETGDEPHYAQARLALDRIIKALAEDGFAPDDVVRTRIYLADISASSQIARAHKETFDSARPTITMAQTAELGPGVLVAIHAEVFSSEGRAERLSRGGKLEDSFGYSIAIARDGQGFVTGLTGMGPDGRIPEGDGPLAQARAALAKLTGILEAQGRELSDVRRTRLYVTDIGMLDQYAEAHREAFGAHPPATTVVEVASLFTPDMALELDADFATGDIVRIDGGSRWEPWFGFTRAIRAGGSVVVSGTTAEGESSDAQAAGIVETLSRSLTRGGADWSDVHHLNVVYRDGADLTALWRELDRALDGRKPTIMPLRAAKLAGDAMLFDVDAEAFVAR